MLVCVVSAMYMVRMRSNGATAALDAMPAIPPASSLHPVLSAELNYLRVDKSIKGFRACIVM